MQHYDIRHYNGTDSLPDFNEAVARARREQGATVRAALTWLSDRRRSRRASRLAGEGRHAA